MDADVQHILEVYRRQGRGLASVTPRVVDLPNGYADVVYSINEGDKTGVKEIRFVGNNQVSASRLRGVMATTESNLLSFLKSTDVYDPNRITADLELIRRYYLKNGYADFRIVSSDVQFDPNAGGYIVTVAVEEGPQYRVGAVNVESRIPELGEDVVRRNISTTAGSVYNADAVQKSLQDVTVDAARKGHAFAQVRPVGTRDPATQTINLGYVVEDGPRVYVERINVRGNSRTRDYVIRREFDLGEGDPYNRVLVDRAERRLNNLGYFKTVRISNEPGSAPDRVVLNVDVEDQSTGAFSVSGGYSTSDGFIGEVSVSEFELPRPWPVRARRRPARPALQRRRFLVHRTVLPRLPHGGRYRSVLEIQRPDEVRPLREPDDRRSASPRFAVHRRIHPDPALLAVSAGSPDPERLQAAL